MALPKNHINTKWSADLAYVIGIIATDGNLSPDNRHIQLTSKDYEMMVNSKKCLAIKNNIGLKSRGASKEKKYFTLQFGSVSFYRFLLKIGLTKRKSKTLGSLDIPQKYFKDFLRGCIDGDGSISISTHPESKHPQYKVRLVSASPLFLSWILEMCQKILKTKGGSISKAPSSTVYTLLFAKEDSITILRGIYYKGVICLSRKYKVAQKILGEWRNSSRASLRN